MKTTFLYIAVVLLVLLGTGVQGQSQGAIWLRTEGHPIAASNGTSVGYKALTQDRDGNILLTGVFRGTLTIGSFTSVNNHPYFLGMFVAKLNAAGTPYWVQTAIGARLNPEAITTDSAGNCYITGSFGTRHDSIATFGSHTIKAKGAQDIFTVKYNASGVLQWLKPAGGPHTYTMLTPVNFLDDSGLSVAADNQGNCYITGYCTDTAYFDNIIFVPPNPTGVPNPTSGFLAKYNSAGAVQWVIQTPGNKIATDAKGFVYMLTKGVTKYNSSGAMLWQQIEPAGTSILAQDIVVGSIGNSYVTGSFTGSTTFSNGTTLGAPNATDAFVARYSNTGVLQWVQSLRDFSKPSQWNAFSSGKKIVTDAAGNSYITGVFKNTIITKLDTFTSLNNNFEVFVARYSPTGNLNAFAQANGPNSNYSYGIAIDSNQDIVVIGDATDATFGSHYLAGHQSFLARLRFATVSSVAEAGGVVGFSVYPNPASGSVTIGLPAFSPGAEVRLLDLTGKVVYMQKLTDAATLFTLPKLPSGCYLVQVQSNKQVWHRILVVQ